MGFYKTNMIRLLMVLSLVAMKAQGEAEGSPAGPQAEASSNPVPQPTKVRLGSPRSLDDEEVKKALGGLPGPVGVSLGVGLPVPAPLPIEVRPPPFPVRHPSTVGRPVYAGQRPECATSENYCLYNQHYPLDKVNAIVDRYYNDVRHIYSDLYQFPPHDIVYYDNRTDGYRDRGHFVCESSVQYLRPGWAQNLHGEWVAVINTDKFPQSMRIETCRYKNKRCEYLPPCYKSRCVQRYNYVKLLCLDPYRPTYKPTVDVFQIPSACSCFVEDFTYY